MLAVTDHAAMFPLTETGPHVTLELAAAAPQSLGLGVIPIFPEAEPAPTFKLPVLRT